MWQQPPYTKRASCNGNPNNAVGSINIIIKQKKNRLLVTRSLRLRKAVITKAEYSAFRQLMIDWNGNKELIFSL